MTGEQDIRRTQRVRRAGMVFLLASAALTLLLTTTNTHAQGLAVGPNVNMVAGKTLPGGDPWLQRQNEPSVAVSTRNACTLFAGANDYRTVDMPGVPGDKETGDGWLGLFKSYDCGRTWKTGLLPGFPQDTSPEGQSSPLKGLQAAADPIIRAGTNGLFFYSGLAFNRGVGAASKVFVARFIDNNDQTTQMKEDSIAYLGTSVVDAGTTGQFLDKPYTAIDIPRGKKPQMCTINGQQVPGGLMYVAWTRFVGDLANNVTKLLVARSRDCGVTWEQPVKISEGFMTNQGATMAIAPNDGTLYVAWRQFLSGSAKHAMVVAKSTDGGVRFSKGAIVANINPFDQATSAGVLSFRTNSYPTIAVDGSGRVHVAWSQRGVTPNRDARVVMATSADGVKWTPPMPVDSYAARGHQIMPAMTIVGGKVQIVYYDLRDDHSVLRYAPGPNGLPYALSSQWVDPPSGDDPAQVFVDAVGDNYPVQLNRRHSIDVRAAQADVGSSSFTVTRVSEYAFGNLVFQEANGTSVGAFEQVSFDPPNLPLYAQGTSPFIGDYVDVAAVSFVRDPSTGAWRFNASADPAAPPMFHVVWTDNRDVAPPPDGNWANYSAPRPGCTPGTTGMRNANVYTAAIMPPLVVGSLDNSKPLAADAPRAFPVFARNTTDKDRLYRFTVTKGAGANWASFQEAGSSEASSLDVWIGAWSGAVRTLYATGTTPTAQLTVTVVEVPQPGVPSSNGQGSVTINPDPLSPALMNPALMNDTFNPALMNRTISNPALMNPALMNPALMNPALMNPADPAWALVNPALMNPALMNPALMNPALMNPALMNPALMNPALMNQEVADPALMNPALMNPALANGLPEDGIITDVTWTVRNDGNAAAAYLIRLLGAKQVPSTNGYYSQLILHKRYVTPAPTSATAGPYACQVGERTQDVVLANIPNPLIVSTADQIEVNDPRLENATMALAPGEQGFVTLRIFDPDRKDNVVRYDAGSGLYYSYDPVFDPKTDVTAKPTSQPSNDPPVPTGTYAVDFSGQPVNSTAGQPIGTVEVHVAGSGANVAGALVTITLVPNGNSGILAGTFTATTDAAGVATFSDLSVSDAGIGYRLQATVPGASPGLSNTFDIAPVLALPGTAILEFISQPSSADGGQPITPSVSVRARDNTSAPIPGLTVTLTVLNNPGGATLSSDTAITDGFGIAYFTLLSVDRGGYGYTLEAQSGLVASAPSTSFNVAGFAGTGSMSTPRLYATATKLLDGSVLVTGGQATYADLALALRTAETYVPVSPGAFSLTAHEMATGRRGHASTLLADGRVLVTGGFLFGSGYYPLYTTSSAEVYDPATGSFTGTMMGGARARHTATLLGDGRVLIAGGFRWWDGAQLTATVYNPGDGTFTDTGNMTEARDEAAATVLATGQVLVVGGGASLASPLNTAEIYDPSAGTFAPTGAMADARGRPSVTLLPNGKVLVAGGTGTSGPLATAELYDPATDTFSLTGSMSSPRTGHNAVLLPAGQVLIAGGYASWPEPLLTAELYDPETGTFTPTGSPTMGRHVGQLAVALDNGLVLVTGGESETAELYYPIVPAPTFSLAFAVDPGPVGTVGQTLPEVRVQLQDGSHNPVAQAGVPVFLSFTANPAAAALTGNVALTDSNGVATFSNLGVDRFVAGYQFVARSAREDVRQSAPSDSFDVALGTLSFVVPPASVPLGGSIPITVGAVRAEGGSMSGSLTLEVLPGPVSTLSSTLASGEATFTLLGLPLGSYTVRASIAGASAITSGPFSVVALPLQIVTDALPPDALREPYSATIMAIGGSGTLTFTVSAGALPPGVALSSAGILSGSPTAAGSFTFTARVADTGGSSNEQLFTIRVFAVDQWASPNPGPVLTSFGNEVAIAQIFTNAAVGQLSGVRLAMSCEASPGPFTTVTAEFHDVNMFDEIQGSVLDSASMSIPTGPHVAGYRHLIPFPFPFSPIGAGFRLALVLSADGPCSIEQASYSFGSAFSDGGMGWAPLAQDLAFETLIMPPGGVLYTATEHHAGDKAVTLGDGRILITSSIGAGEIYDPVSQTFASTGAMLTPRWNYTATRLIDGKVLIVGGIHFVSGNWETVTTAEVFDPAAAGGVGAFSYTTGAPNHPRSDHTATLLPDGTVLIAGGHAISGGVYGDVLQTETYNPGTGQFLDGAPMGAGRHSHTATLLATNDKVLFAGGNPQSAPSPTAEVYDVATGTFSATFVGTGNAMLWQRAEHTATLLNDGRVLLAGGASVYGVLVPDAEIFDPVTESFTPAGALLTPRLWHTATLLDDGSVLLTSGRSSYAGLDMGLGSAERYVPGVGFSGAGNVLVGRLQPSAVRVGAKVFIVGGDGESRLSRWAGELYDPAADRVVLSLNPVSLPDARTGQLYSNPRLTASGGTNTSYMFRIVEGTLPTGLYLFGGPSPTTWVEIRGTPADNLSRDYRFTLEVRDSGNPFNATYQTLTVRLNPLVVTTFTMPSGYLGVPYFKQVQAEGLAPITWAINGTLPDGLTLDPATGTISGMPTMVGPHAFFVVATDGTGHQATRELGIVVSTLNLSFDTTPSRVTAGQPMAPLTVLAADAGGDPVAGLLVTMGFGSNPGGATLSGSLAAATGADGIAHFTNLQIDHGGYDYTLSASAGPAVGAASVPFDVEGFANQLAAAARMLPAVVRLADGKVLIAGGWNDSSSALASADIYDPATHTVTPAGSPMVVGRLGLSGTLLPDGRVLIAGGYDADGYLLSSAELYDPAYGTFSATNGMTTARVLQSTVLLPNGKVFVVGGSYASSRGELYDPATGFFTETVGTMSGPLAYGTTATLLGDGSVLVAGGTDNSGPLARAEVFDPATGYFVATHSLTAPRAYHAAVRLPDGRVLVVGGSDYAFADLANGEIYTPGVGWTPIGSTMPGGVGGPQLGAALLPSGNVLVSGGHDGSYSVEAATLFDPVSETFAAAGSMSASRMSGALVVGGNGLVLAAGGQTIGGSVELFHPLDPPYASAGFETGVSLATARRGHTATRLPNGSILVAGGYDASGTALNSAELCNPISGTCTVLPASMTTARARHTATLLPSGKVLFVSGDTTGHSCDLFDSEFNTFAATGSLRIGRGFHTATLLPSGKVLVTGGSSAAVAELYDPSTGSWTDSAGLPGHTNEYYSAAVRLANGKVLVIGSDVGDARLYDPLADAFLFGATIGTSFHEGFALTTLANGKVLLTGLGNTLGENSPRLYDPVTGLFSSAGSMSQVRSDHTATVLANGKVLVAGGSSYLSTPVATAELYDPATNAFTAVLGTMADVRDGHTAVVLANGKVWIAGGRNASTMAVATADTYRPR